MNGRLSRDASVLSGMTGRGIRIAVVDSGVAASHPHVGAVGSGCALVGEDPGDVADRLGHGTAVFAAIRDQVPDAELLPVRVLDRQLATSARILAQAIDWAVQAGVHIVNLSFGTTNAAHLPLFEASLAMAEMRGVAVISAYASGEAHWLPGSMHGAVGVTAEPEMPRSAIAVVEHSAGRCIAASPYPRPIPGVPVERNLSGVSFAVANATGVIARALQAGAPAAPRDALLDWIAAQALPQPPIAG
jgi:subtilisin family serine protease